jgi:hypothetical protein
MISCEYCPSPFEQGDPATNFKTLSAFINDDEIKLSFGQIFPKNLVSGADIGTANDISIM